MWRPGIVFEVGLVTVVFVFFCPFFLRTRSPFQYVGFAILSFVKARRLVARPGRSLVMLVGQNGLDQRVDSLILFFSSSSACPWL